MKKGYETMRIALVGTLSNVVQSSPHGKPCGAADGRSGSIGNCSDGGRGRSP